MKFSKKIQNWAIASGIIVMSGVSFFVLAKDTNQCLPISEYYGYDRGIPLQDSVRIALDTTDFTLSSFSYTSVHDKRVTGLLSVPKNVDNPVPVIILMHGLGDHKAVDYVVYGNDLFLKNGYVVIRLDISQHGDRKETFFDFDLTGQYKQWTREIISQTVFDLRRSIDFIETRKELDSDRIGYYGIS
ncbi:MAG: hypothetical protein HKN31_03425, partial [Pricia sp.]|nr:hypothetical protein [Pricia sp.]